MRKLLTLLLCVLVLTAAGAIAERTSRTVGAVLFENIPELSEGLEITDISIEDRYAVITCYNRSDHQFTGYAHMNVKVYNQDNVITNSGRFYLDSMEPGEHCISGFYLGKGTAKVVFYDLDISKGNVIEKPTKFKKIDRVNFGPMHTEYTGIEFKIDSVNRTRVRGIATNTTDKPIAAGSVLTFKCYGRNNLVLGNGYVSVKDMNPGETCKVEFHLDDMTTKVIFFDWDVKEGVMSERVPTQTIRKCEFNQTPYDLGGIVIENIDFNSAYRAKLTLHNVSGKPVDDSTRFDYKATGEDGTVNETGSVRVEHMNEDDRCDVVLQLRKADRMVIFSNLELVEGEHIDRPNTVSYGKVESNAAPFETNGLTVTDLSFSNQKAILVVRNDTGKPISGGSIEYRVLDADNKVTDTNFVYIPAMNPGESCEVDRHTDKHGTQVLFGEAKTNTGNLLNTDVPLIVVSKHASMNTIPYTTNGIEITKAEVTNKSVRMVVTNKTEKSVHRSTYIPYRCYNESGHVLFGGTFYLENMSPGEQCAAMFRINKHVTKIIIGEANVEFD